MRCVACLLATVLSTVCVDQSLASTSTPIRFDIVGTLTDVGGINSPPDDTPEIGSAFTGSYVFDVSAAGTPGTAGYRVYHTPYPAGVVSLQVGDWGWQETGEAPMTIVVGDNAKSTGDGLKDSFHVDNSRIERTTPPERPDIYTLFRWNLEGPTDIFASDNLPRSPFPLEPWSKNRWSISIWGMPPAPLLELSGSVMSFQAVALTEFADFNGDGPIDSQDLAIWRAGFGTSSGATLNDGDADGDGDVDGGDFSVWQRQVNGGQAGATAVPEPVCSALLALSAAALACRRSLRYAASY